MNRLVIVLSLLVLFLQSGCAVISRLGTPSEREKKITAEYNLSGHVGQKILVLVDQPQWLAVRANLRYYLTQALNEYLAQKVRIPSRQLVPYSQLAKFRSNRPDFSLLSPKDIGRALNADVVLLAQIEAYELKQIATTDYHKGSLNARAVLIDTVSGQKLWPQAAKAKKIQVGFDVERSDKLLAMKRLSVACAHCVVRHLYDCPKTKFKIADDQSGVAWQQW